MVNAALAGTDDVGANGESGIAPEHEFLDYASHELRTPLTIVLTNLEVLVGELDGEQAGLAQAALLSTERMVRLLEDLLARARTHVRPAHPHQPIDLAEVVTAAVIELDPIASGHELSVRSESTVVLGVRDDLHRLVLNLVENAMRHTPRGTHIELLTGTRDGYAVVEIEDDGPGIAPALAHRAFQRYARGARTETTGSGLGLAIVREVAESHGGTVMLERPASGHGARFVVRLRPVPPPARRRATPAPAWLAQANQPPAGAEHANSQPPVSDPGEPR